MTERDGMQRFYARSLGTKRPPWRWKPPRWTGLLGIAWIVGIVSWGLYVEGLSVWMAALAMWGTVGIVQLWAFWRRKEEEWADQLRRLYVGGAMLLGGVFIYLALART